MSYRTPLAVDLAPPLEGLGTSGAQITTACHLRHTVGMKDILFRPVIYIFVYFHHAD
jgi:hypothetical protein